MSFDELLEILRVLNDSPSITPLHDEIIELVLTQIKKVLEKN